MFLIDVNVLLAAHRGDHPNHRTVRPWFDRLLRPTTPSQCRTWWASFLRLTTNRRIFEIPSPRADALHSSKPSTPSPITFRAAPAPDTWCCCENSATRPTHRAT
ncbi:TA system VapC family ribonuclease toxin [Mycobacterium tuberculosis]|uniref:TA system VapC family ribonuclease toxin n=1 Tax=Mycobacterium tuberculosis TaxID=1773 RepID=UPI003D7C2FD2